jgi:hypothetical protein
MASSDHVLEEQIAYYRSRAGEYDEWFLRQGRYDHGPEGNARWFAEVEQVTRARDIRSGGRRAGVGQRHRPLDAAAGADGADADGGG